MEKEVFLIFSNLKGYFNLFSSIFSLVTHVIWFFMPYSCTSPCWIFIVPLSMMGLNYSLFTGVLWPSIGLAVKPTMVGTAYGVSNCI
jgi:hypothetical protein